MENTLKIGDRVCIVGYDSSGKFNHHFKGTVVDSTDETVKVLLDLGYHARVAYQQCVLIQSEAGGAV